LSARILAVAAELFLRDGYGATSIEAIAAAAGMSKRTLYARYANKAEIFAAVVRHIIDEVRPPQDVPLIEGETLSAVLVRLGGFILAAALAPKALGLYRLMVAESERFPELAKMAATQGALAEAVGLIATLLKSQGEKKRHAVRDPEFAAQQFIFMVLALPQRRALGLGKKMTSSELRSWLENTVALFLHGYS